MIEIEDVNKEVPHSFFFLKERIILQLKVLFLVGRKCRSAKLAYWNVGSVIFFHVCPKLSAALQGKKKANLMSRTKLDFLIDISLSSKIRPAYV